MSRIAPSFDLTDHEVFVAGHLRASMPTASNGQKLLDNPTAINIDTDLTIGERAEALARSTRIEGSAAFAAHSPDGTLRKLFETSCLTAFGSSRSIDYDQGVASTSKWFNEHAAKALGMQQGMEFA